MAEQKKGGVEGKGARTGSMQDWEVGTLAGDRNQQPAPTPIPTSN